ncbi:MAG: hypothetical protein LBV04_06050 [Deferribacteraceae bacterium]|jgi:hypothetical protein|nr:hypothetical protein [Deferribacteraceae bacterium]
MKKFTLGLVLIFTLLMSVAAFANHGNNGGHNNGGHNGNGRPLPQQGY